MDIQGMITYIQARRDMARYSENGASAVEYGLLVALIAAVIIGAVTLFGSKLSTIFGNVNSSMG